MAFAPGRAALFDLERIDAIALGTDRAAKQTDRDKCSWPTSCTFGGPDLATLFITSARFTMTAEHLQAVPIEGGLFACEPGAIGSLEPMFAG